MKEMPISTSFRYHPPYVHLVLSMMSDGYTSEDVDIFEEQWGGLDIETLLAVLEKGRGIEKVFALFCLGSSHTQSSLPSTKSCFHFYPVLFRWSAG